MGREWCIISNTLWQGGQKRKSVGRCLETNGSSGIHLGSSRWHMKIIFLQVKQMIEQANCHLYHTNCENVDTVSSFIGSSAFMLNNVPENQTLLVHCCEMIVWLKIARLPHCDVIATPIIGKKLAKNSWRFPISSRRINNCVMVWMWFVFVLDSSFSHLPMWKEGTPHMSIAGQVSLWLTLSGTRTFCTLPFTPPC